jgi:hypothetical protein
VLLKRFKEIKENVKRKDEQELINSINFLCDSIGERILAKIRMLRAENKIIREELQVFMQQCVDNI